LANVSGPVIPGGGDDGLLLAPNAGVVTMEWSNALAFVLQRQGQKVKCGMSKERSGDYVLDDRADSRMISYVDLFKEWEKMLKFQVKGQDAEEG
jgi:hypothetical protein